MLETCTIVLITSLYAGILEGSMRWPRPRRTWSASPGVWDCFRPQPWSVRRW